MPTTVGPNRQMGSQNPVMYFTDLTGDTSMHGAIHVDQTLIAQEGSASPLPERNDEFLSSRGMDINNFNSVVFKANLTGDTATDEVIIKDNVVFKQEGGPASGGFSITSFGLTAGPDRIDDSGRSCTTLNGTTQTQTSTPDCS